MNPIVFAIPVFMLTIVLEAWLAHRRAAKVYDIPDAITSLHHGVLSQIVGVYLKLATLAIYALTYQAYRLTELPETALWVWVFALLAYDFCYYWLHRLGHEVNILWAAHVVHHSSEYFNLSTALRQTATGALLGWLFFLPLAVAGVPPQVFVVVALTNLLYQYWVHTELIGKLGWFDRVFCSPSNHRVHHGQNDYCIDKNYGGILMLWDRLFGTFEEERADDKVIYGIRKPLRSFSPLWGNAHYYAELWHLSRAASGWRNKLGVWLTPPGGWGESLPHFDTSTFRHFDTGTPAPLRWYVAAQYAISVPFVTHFLATFGQLSAVTTAIYALGIIASGVILGALLEARKYAHTLEVLRLTLFAGTFALMPNWFGLDTPSWLRLIVTGMLAGAGVWLCRQAVQKGESIAVAAPERRT